MTLGVTGEATLWPSPQKSNRGQLFDVHYRKWDLVSINHFSVCARPILIIAAQYLSCGDTGNNLSELARVNSPWRTPIWRASSFPFLSLLPFIKVKSRPLSRHLLALMGIKFSYSHIFNVFSLWRARYKGLNDYSMLFTDGDPANKRTVSVTS